MTPGPASYRAPEPTMIFDLPSASHQHAGPPNGLWGEAFSFLCTGAGTRQPLGRCPKAASQERQRPSRTRPPRNPRLCPRHITSVTISHSQAKRDKCPGQATPGQASRPSKPRLLRQTGSVCNSNGIFLSLFSRSNVRQIARQNRPKKETINAGCSSALSLLASSPPFSYCVGSVSQAGLARLPTRV